MKDEQALLRAIADNPNDDAPRLVYLDWLQERCGSEREDFVEFARLQFKLRNYWKNEETGENKVIYKITTREHANKMHSWVCLKKRVQKLLGDNWHKWTVGTRRLFGYGDLGLSGTSFGLASSRMETLPIWFQFDRGFPSILRIAIDTFGRSKFHRPLALSNWPIHTVDFYNADPWLNDNSGQEYRWQYSSREYWRRDDISLGWLPNKLFIKAMPLDARYSREDRTLERYGMFMRTFRTKKAAMKALNDAAINILRDYRAKVDIDRETLARD